MIRALVSRLLPGCQRVALVFAMLGLLPGPDGFSVQAQAMEVAVLLSEAEGRGQRFAEALDAALAPGMHRLVAAGVAGVQADVHEVRQPADLVPALDHLLFAGDALLPLPDGLVSGPAAARTILLTSYRHRRPVFAHSAAYVTAGALAAVFSTPEHVAMDVADLLAGAAEPSAMVRKIHPPRRFDVAVNRAVARALGLVVADEKALRERIANGGER